jgi:hypothetical protein
MQKQMAHAQLSCTDSVILVSGVEKTCKNFSDENGESKILCNAKRFLETSDEDQYVLVHHEYAGLSGFEVNDGADSQYQLSNQITGYLQNQVVKKLAVLPNNSDDGENLINLPMGTVIIFPPQKISTLPYTDIYRTNVTVLTLPLDAFNVSSLECDVGIIQNDPNFLNTMQKGYTLTLLYGVTISGDVISDFGNGYRFSVQSDDENNDIDSFECLGLHGANWPTLGELKKALQAIGGSIVIPAVSGSL